MPKQVTSANRGLPKELADILPKGGAGRFQADRFHIAEKAGQIRLSLDVLSAFKSRGRGWPTRINDALGDWLKEHRRG